jgi:hypothetical protein
MPNITNIPASRVPLIEDNSTLMSREWYRFFYNIFELTGGGTNDLSVNDLAQAPAPMTAEAFAEINSLYSLASSLPRPELGTMAALQQDNVPWLRFSLTGLPYTPPVGTIWWGDRATVNIQATNNVTQPIGESQYYYVKADAAITKGQVVMFTGAVGASGVLKAAPAQSVTIAEYIMGVAAENIALNGFGLITSFGLVKGINTNAFNEGDELYYNPSSVGGFTATPPNQSPTAPATSVLVAAVINKSVGNGSVFVRVSAGSKLGGSDSNVQFSTLNNGDLIRYDSASGYWKNVAASAIGTVSSISFGSTGLTPATATTGAVTVAGTLAVANGGTALSSTPTNGQLLIGNGTNYSLSTLTAGSGISISNGAGSISISATTAGGTVTSVSALTLGTTGTDLSSTVANPTTTPVITLNVPTASATNRGALSSTDWSTFNGKQAALVSGTNIKTVNGTSLLGSGDVGTITADYGGTGQTSYTIGDLLYASGATTLSKLADVATGNALISGGVGVAPSWGKIGLTTHISGTLAVGNGGTGSTAYTAGYIPFSNGTSLTSSDKVFWDDSLFRLGINTAASPLSPLHVRALNSSGTLIDSASILLVGGASFAVRFGTDVTSSKLEGVDVTGSGSYQPFSVGGSEVLFKLSDVQKGKFSGDSFFVGGNTDAGRMTYEFSSGIYGRGGRYSSTTGTAFFDQFIYNGTQKGTISCDGSVMTYGGTSDYRLKKDYREIPDVLARIRNLRPIAFAWTDTEKSGEGFLAHELQEIIPYAVVGEKDAVDIDGNPRYQMVDYAKLTPILTAALQSALNKIDALEARVSDLEA